jgi:hypothetical protein
MQPTYFEERTYKEYLREQAWNYFQLHATQRLTTFNYYLVLSTAITAAIAITFQKDFRLPALDIVLSLLLVGISYVFLKLDGRNIELVKYGEAALKYFEKTEQANFPDEATGAPHEAQLFRREEYMTRKKTEHSEGRPPWEQHYTYGKCLHLTIWFFMVGGSLLFLYSVQSYMP